jgi:hypothetical protein
MSIKWFSLCYMEFAELIVNPLMTTMFSRSMLWPHPCDDIYGHIFPRLLELPIPLCKVKI